MVLYHVGATMKTDVNRELTNCNKMLIKKKKKKKKKACLQSPHNFESFSTYFSIFKCNQLIKKVIMKLKTLQCDFTYGQYGSYIE